MPISADSAPSAVSSRKGGRAAAGALAEAEAPPAPFEDGGQPCAREIDAGPERRDVMCVQAGDGVGHALFALVVDMVAGEAGRMEARPRDAGELGRVARFRRHVAGLFLAAQRVRRLHVPDHEVGAAQHGARVVEEAVRIGFVQHQVADHQQ